MTRGFALGMLLAAGALSIAVVGYQSPPGGLSQQALATTKIDLR